MKFKIPKGTETYEKLEALWERIHAADSAAYALVRSIRKEMGLPHEGDEHNYAGSRHLAGGIAAIQFETKPEAWKQVGKPYQRLYAPLAREKAMWARIKALPIVPVEDLNNIVGFERFVSIADGGDGLVAHRAPGMRLVPDAFLMEVPSKATYTPPNGDIIEILESEYNRLADAGRKETQSA